MTSCSRAVVARIATWDGVVEASTPSMRWAIGKQIETVMIWLDEIDVHWSIAGHGRALHD